MLDSHTVMQNNGSGSAREAVSEAIVAQPLPQP